MYRLNFLAMHDFIRFDPGGKMRRVPCRAVSRSELARGTELFLTQAAALDMMCFPRWLPGCRLVGDVRPRSKPLLRRGLPRK